MKSKRDLSTRPGFAGAVRSSETLFIQYCPDALTARLCEQLGFDGGYVGGGGLGYTMAVSEALLTLSEISAVTASISRRSALPLVVDGGVGYGDAVHTARTVWDLEAAGAFAIELEDQVTPKRASHHRHVEHLEPVEVMIGKVQAAVEARRDPDLLIIARTGAVQNEDFDHAIDRCNAYLAAGADAAMLLVNDAEQRAEAPKRVNGPLGTLTSFDLHSREEWSQLGWSLVVDPVTGQSTAFAALRDAYERQASGHQSLIGAQQAFEIYETLQHIAGFDELYDIERRTTEVGT